jgi:hypothetical protein
VRAKMPYRRNGSEESHEGERDTKHHKQDAKSHRRSLGVVILWSLPLRITLRSDVATVQNILAPFVKLDDNPPVANTMAKKTAKSVMVGSPNDPTFNRWK